MLRLTRKHAIENLCGLFLSRITLVARHRSRSDKSQRVKHGRLLIRNVTLVQLFHRLVVSKRARAMVHLVCVFVESLHRGDVVALALRTRTGELRLLDRRPPTLQLISHRRGPERMIVAHRDAPVSHPATRIGSRNLSERLFSLLIFK
jgi:hypothetical protein